MSSTAVLTLNNPNTNLAVWRSKLVIPKDVMYYADTEWCPRRGELIGLSTRERNGIEISYLTVNAYHYWHHDKHYTNEPYTGLHVIRNEARSWVEAVDCPVIKKQPVGTMVSLNIHRQHRLNAPKGRFAIKGTWVCVAVDSHYYRTPLEWEETFAEIYA